MSAKYPQTPINTSDNTQIANTLVNADGTTAQDIVNGATNGSLITDINVVSDDSANMEVILSIYDGGASRQLGKISVPAGSGNDTAKPAVSLLDPAVIPGLAKRDDEALTLATGQKLQASVVSAVTTAKTLTITAFGANYGV